MEEDVKNTNIITAIESDKRLRKMGSRSLNLRQQIYPQTERKDEDEKEKVGGRALRSQTTGNLSSFASNTLLSPSASSSTPSLSLPLILSSKSTIVGNMDEVPEWLRGTYARILYKDATLQKISIE